MKKALIAIIVISILAVGGYFFYQQSGDNLQGKFDIKSATDPISAKGDVTRKDVTNSDKADADSEKTSTDNQQKTTGDTNKK